MTDQDGKLEAMLRVLQCPRTGTSLRRQDAETLRSEAGEIYPIIRGKPVLVRRVESLHTTPPSEAVISKNVAGFAGPEDLPADAVVVHLGCGEVPSSDPRVISTDILPTAAADVVAEAEHMPFKTGIVDFLSSGAVFEHVYDPVRSAAEVRRILKEGGRFYIDTAFMQGYHGYPSHFFNMTPQAVETLIVDDFILEGSTVPDGATCAHLFLEVQQRMLDTMDPARAQELLDKPFREVVAIFRRDESRANPYLAGFPEYAHRALASSFVVVGRKPRGYDAREPAMREEAAPARRAYYAARMGVIHRYGEVELYSRRCALAGRTLPDAPPPEPLGAILTRHAVRDTAREPAYVEATQALSDSERDLTALRDRWITLLCS